MQATMFARFYFIHFIQICFQLKRMFFFIFKINTPSTLCALNFIDFYFNLKFGWKKSIFFFFLKKIFIKYPHHQFSCILFEIAHRCIPLSCEFSSAIFRLKELYLIFYPHCERTCYRCRIRRARMKKKNK